MLLEGDEVGTKYRGRAKKRESPKRERGLSLSWGACVKALQVKAYFQYRDGTRGKWEQVMTSEFVVFSRHV